MKSADEARRGHSYVYATSDADVLAGRGQEAVVLGIESILPEGKKRRVKMLLVAVGSQEIYVEAKHLHGSWARYAEGVATKAVASSEAVQVTTEILRRLVRHGIVQRPPTDSQVGPGRGGIWYWTGPVRHRQQPDGRPIGVDIHLSTEAAAAFLAVLPEPKEPTP